VAGAARARLAPADPRLPPTLQVIERGWLSANMVVFDEAAAVSIVDTGYADHADLTLALVERVAAGRPLARILNTHLHSDHCAGNAALAARHAAPILIPPGLAAAVEAWDEQVLNFASTGQHCPRFRHAGLLAPGAVLHAGGLDWEVLAAPGHDPHMVMLWSAAEGVLLSADALWQDGFGAIFPEIEGESGFAEQRAVLDLIEARAPRVAIPGHGAPFTDVADALGRARRRLAALAADPRRNARHVLKVLLKFWLLQVRDAHRDELRRHFTRAAYPAMIARRYFDHLEVADLLARAVDELCVAGAARRSGERVLNVDS